VNESALKPVFRNPRTFVLTLIGVGVLARLLLAASIGLGVDESYAVAVARQYSLSYFDHPPLHFWLAGFAAKFWHSEAGLVVRFPFVLCFAGTTWLLFRLTARFFGEQAGAVAALLLNISAVFSLSTGGWVLPDGPLLLLMLASTNVFADLLFDESMAPESQALGRWLLGGLLAGLAMLAKYHGVFVLGGLFLFLLSSRPHRRWLATPGPYVAGVVAAFCFLPVIIWNSKHGWASFVFQGARASGGGGGIHPEAMLTNLAGQAGWVLPWIWIPLVVTLYSSLTRGPKDAARWFLFCIGIGPIAAFTLIALRGSVGLPHWQAPGYLFFFPALGAAAAARIGRGQRGTSRWLWTSAAAFVVLVAVLASQAATGWMKRAIPQAFAKGDPTADLVDWSSLRPALIGRGLLPVDGFVAAPSWIQAGKASIGLEPDTPVLCLCADPHHFYYLHDDRKFLGRNAVIVKKFVEGEDVEKLFAPYFDAVTVVSIESIYRNGSDDVMRVGIYRGRNFKKLFPTTQPR
jgi:4-amino-4-deoxy-L-arabinose transferase-like glycosyltransferase